MPRQRHLSWSTALQGLRADRAQVPAGFLCVRGRIEVAARLGKVVLVNADGSFNLAGIMAAATVAAKEHQRVYGSTWAAAMSVALKACWQAARTTRAKVAH
ncbi:hypothetical protein H0176_26510 [Methylorubrum populi]|uniref:hypothetical protein n=1 Tax=Methylorubrum rhodesianum TaxID=29427 RepID=UPI00190B8240|nr:hypothetical protein [Methylorubrum rhodesianum]MBK3401244.1 hypothetical protein [Methylorubrum rhodesianum]MBY0143783.1 hypothetical protein [Methylorubrum populi]